MLQVANISKTFGSQVLFENLSFAMERKERLGLVGRNGSGKSTLFRMILGEEPVDEGTIRFPKNYTIASLEQHIRFSQPTLLTECTQDIKEEEKYQVERILSGLGFSKEDFDRKPEVFSGGFQLRIQLAKVLAKHSDLLLLDEPTNYLDIVSIRWLKGFLQSFPGEFVLITHDRKFMDDVTTHIMGIHRGKLRKVKGKYQKYQDLVATDEESFEKNRVNQDKAIRDMKNYIARFRASARRASQAQSRIKKLNKMEEVKKLDNEVFLDFHFNYEECPGKTLCQVKNLTFDYDAKNENPMINKLTFSLAKGERMAIIGANGKGKSTLLNVLAGELKPLTGFIHGHPVLTLGHFGQTNINRLNLDRSIEEEISASNDKLGRQEVMNICGTMMFGGNLAQKKISVLSGGERSRVLLGKILATPANLLLLDEPTNHLDHESIEALLEGLEDFPGAVLMVTHSEFILNRMAKKLIVFHRGRAEFFEGDYNYFLRKYGWEDEIQKNKDKPSSNKYSKKEARKKRGEIIFERSQKLAPLKQKMEDFENRITQLESEWKIKNEHLIQASQEQKGSKIQELSIELGKIEKKVNELFDRLEIVTQEHDVINEGFEERLKF